MGAVLITGAGSGIGLATARLLAERGFRVYGGVRKSEDAKALRALGVVPLFLDVTQEESLVQARRLLEGEGLEGLVANAGKSPKAP